jgi:hypothetical protein
MSGLGGRAFAPPALEPAGDSSIVRGVVRQSYEPTTAFAALRSRPRGRPT